MHIDVKPILVSHNRVTGDTLYTMVLTYPRFILAEVNTHRMLSRNTSSSRAVPTAKMRKRVLDDMFLPYHMGKNEKGMQAYSELTGWRRRAAYMVWEAGGYLNSGLHFLMEKLGVHKQIANRLIEPWMWTEQLVSFTDYNNFLLQRDHHAAEPHMRELARQVRNTISDINHIIWSNKMNDPDPSKGRAAIRVSGMFIHDYIVQSLMPGEQHLPFINYNELILDQYKGTDIPLMVSSARCARVSYYLNDGKTPSVEEDLDLYNRLAGSTPKHMSPLEHPSIAMDKSFRLGNFKGFMQFRKTIADESGQDETPPNSPI